VTQLEIERRLAIADLLAQPDPPDLGRRGYRLRVEGKPERFDLVPQLAAVFVQRKLLSLHERRAEGVASEMYVPARPMIRSVAKVVRFAA
jgi:hypothetical protein